MKRYTISGHDWDEYESKDGEYVKWSDVAPMIEALKNAHAHVAELREAWERGSIREIDNLGGTRSNRNVDVEVELRKVIE